MALCFNSVGYFVMNRYLREKVKREIKQEIKSGVPAGRLTTIIYTAGNSGEFKWKDEKEFSYRGNMYDIVSQECLPNGLTLFHCINDEQETVLFRNLNQLVNNSLNGNAKNTSAFLLLSTFLTGLFIPQTTHYATAFHENTIIFGTEYQGYHVPVIIQNFPPPKEA